MPRASLFPACAALLAASPFTTARAQEQISVFAPLSAASPVSRTTLSATGIETSGVSSMGALLDQLPAFGSQGVNAAQTDGGYGEYFVDLRNLNFDRTLVMIDGQRFVPSGIRTDEAVDLNNIPLAFIDHVDILQDGSQPLYAADAVAGAVNIVLKDHAEGLHLSAYGGATSAADAGSFDVALTGGHSWASGHVAFGVDVQNRDPILQSSRGWSANPIASAATTQGGALLTYGSTATTGGHAIGQGVDAVALGGGATAPYSPASNFNFAPFRDLEGGLQRESFFLDAASNLSDSVTASINVLFSDRRATTLQPPQILGLTSTEKYPDGFTIPADVGGNPFNTPVTLERVLAEAGPQQTVTSGPVWRLRAGLDGAWRGWDWSVSLQHGESTSEYTTGNAINLTRALQTAGALACPASAGCVPADWFGPGSLSAASLSYIGYTSIARSAYTETAALASVSGTLFDAPAGPATMRAGAELRAEHGATSVDAVTASGDQAGPDAAPTSGGYATREAYALFAVPLLRDLPLAQRLDLTATARGTDTDRYGSFATFRGVLDDTPAPGLHLRAVTGIARRPPAISEAFGGITAARQPVDDPCDASTGLRRNPTVNANCLAQGLGPGFTQTSPLIQVESGGNPHLRPEQSENEELGITFDPPAWPFLSLRASWYHYRIKDAIDSLEDTDPDVIPDACYQSPHLSSPLCALLTRIGVGGNAGQIGNILGLDENVGTIKTSGFEFGATLRTPQTAFGQGALQWDTNWLTDYRIHETGEGGFTQYAGAFPGLSGVGSYARIRSRLSADWHVKDWAFGWTGRFISGARVLGDEGQPFSKAPGILYQDISLTRHAGALTLMAGVDNLTDQRPPTLIDGETNTSTSTYDVAGLFAWGRISVAF